MSAARAGTSLTRDSQSIVVDGALRDAGASDALPAERLRPLPVQAFNRRRPARRTSCADLDSRCLMLPSGDGHWNADCRIRALAPATSQLLTTFGTSDSDLSPIAARLSAVGSVDHRLSTAIERATGETAHKALSMGPLQDLVDTGRRRSAGVGVECAGRRGGLVLPARYKAERRQTGGSPARGRSVRHQRGAMECGNPTSPSLRPPAVGRGASARPRRPAPQAGERAGQRRARSTGYQVARGIASRSQN